MTGRLEACIRLAQKVGIKGKNILDVGCSYPWFIKYAIDKGAKSVAGIEPNRKKVIQARKQVPRATIKVGYANKLNFPSRSFDLVTIFDVIEHVPKNTELEVFQEINRVLNRKGRLLISTPYDNWIANFADPAWYFGHRHYSKVKLKSLLEKAGFKTEKTYLFGSKWELIGMWMLYFSKWVLGTKMLFEEWFDTRRRDEFRHKGFTHIMVIAQKSS